MLCKLRNIMGNSKRRHFPKSVAWFCSCYQKWKIYLTANHNQGFQSNYSQNDNTKWSRVFGKFFHPGLNKGFSRVKICHQNNVSGWSKVFHFHLLPSKILCLTFLITGSGLVGKITNVQSSRSLDALRIRSDLSNGRRKGGMRRNYFHFRQPNCRAAKVEPQVKTLCKWTI